MLLLESLLQQSLVSVLSEMMMLEVQLGLPVSSILRFDNSTGDVRVRYIGSVVDVFASVTDAAADVGIVVL